MSSPARVDAPEPLWRRAILERGRDQFGERNCGTLARVALKDILARAGEDVSLVTIHTWTRKMQGDAYLWALDRVNGGEAYVPYFITASRLVARKRA